MKTFICAVLFVLACGVGLPASLAAEPINPGNLPGKFFFKGFWQAESGPDIDFSDPLYQHHEIYWAPANGHERRTLIRDYYDVHDLYWYADQKKLGLVLESGTESIHSNITPNGLVEFDLSQWKGGEIDRAAAKQSLLNGKPLPPSISTRLTYSPDGRKVAGIRNAQICVADVNGGRPGKCIENQKACSLPPVWSPDGKQFVFVGGTDGVCRSTELFIANADAENLRQLTDVPDERLKETRSKEGVKDAFMRGSYQPAWSPDGQWIAFISTHGLAKIRPDGTGFQVITTNAADPAWSPDSKMIAYVATRGETPETFRYGIFVSWANGTGETWITKDLEMFRANEIHRFRFIYQDLNWAE